MSEINQKNAINETEEMIEARLLGNLLGNLATRMRENLGELSLADWKMAPPEKRERFPKLDKNAAYSYQSRTRILRAAQNMETLGALLRQPDFERESCDIVELASDFCEEAADLAKMRGEIQLTFSCMENAHICAIHPEYMRQFLGHLVCNAMKNASEDSTVKKYVRVSLRFGEEAVLSVEDNGRGIAPEQMPALFEEGWRNSPGTLYSGGAGLGLSVCKRIAAGHGGTLTAESTPGKGSQFTLRIPDEKGLMKFRQPGFYEPNGGVNPMMIMLSDALPWEAFTVENLL